MPVIKLVFEDPDLTLNNELTVTLGYTNEGDLTGNWSGKLYPDASGLLVDVSPAPDAPESPPPTLGAITSWLNGSGFSLYYSRNITADTWETYTVTRNGELDETFTFSAGTEPNSVQGVTTVPIVSSDVITVDFTNDGSVRGAEDDVPVVGFSDESVDTSASPSLPAIVQLVAWDPLKISIEYDSSLAVDSYETFTITRNGVVDTTWTYQVGNTAAKIRGTTTETMYSNDVLLLSLENTGNIRSATLGRLVEDFTDEVIDVSGRAPGFAHLVSAVGSALGHDVLFTYDEALTVTPGVATVTIDAVEYSATVTQPGDPETFTVTLDEWGVQFLSSSEVTVSLDGSGIVNGDDNPILDLVDEPVDCSAAPATATRFATTFAGESGAYEGAFDRTTTDVSAIYSETTTPTYSGVVLHFTNSTGTVQTFDAQLSGLIPDSGEDFEILTLCRMNDGSVGRTGPCLSSGTPGFDTALVMLAPNSLVTTPRLRLTGTQVTLDYVSITPSEYEAEWRWHCLGVASGTAYGMSWAPGEEKPASPMVESAYSAVAATKALGIESALRSAGTLCDVAYFAAAIGETDLPVPVWEATEMPAAKYVYTDDDWDPDTITLDLRPDVEGGLDRLYPFTWHGDDSQTPGSAELHALIDVYDSKPNNIAADIIARYTTGYGGLLPMHHVSQQNQTSNQAFASPLSNCLVTTTDPVAGNVAPQHFMYLDGTTVSNTAGNLSAITGSNSSTSTITLTVGDASKITVGRHLIWRTALGTWTNIEYLYCTARNTTANTITVTRGWRGPQYQSSSYAIAHPLSGGTYGYVASHFYQSGTGTVSGANILNPSAVTWQWRFQFTPETDAQFLDAAGKRLIDYCGVDIATAFKAASDTAVAAGVPLAQSWPDGTYDDANPDNVFYGFTADYDNDGTADWGNDALTVAGTDQFRAGHQARKALIHAYNDVADLTAALVIDGVPANPASEDESSGVEAESVLYGSASKFAYPPNLAELQNGIQLLKWYPRRGSTGPRITGQSDCVPSYTYPLTSFYAGTRPTTDKYQRLYMALSWILGTGYGVQHASDQAPYIPWRDEYSVGPDGVSRVITDGHAAVAPYRHWMGRKIAKFARYDPGSDFDISNNQTPNPVFASGSSEWSSTNVTLSVETDGDGPTGGNWLKCVPTTYEVDFSGSTTAYSGYPVTAGVQNTLILALRGSVTRPIVMSPATGILESTGLYISPEWAYYIWTFVATGSTANLSIGTHRGRGEVHVGHVLSFAGNLGVLYQDFENALVLANSTSEDVTVTLPAGAGYHRINGTQRGPSDPSWVNDGSAVSGTVLVPAYDGVILVKDSYLSA